MQRLGTVDRTAQGLAIARVSGDYDPAIGNMVIDESLETIGRVVDVFGPVETPYVAVTTDDDVNLATLLGEKLYVKD
jgi:RNA-binding protein